MNKPLRTLIVALLVLMLLGSLPLLVTPAEEPEAEAMLPFADPAVSRITTTNSAMMFNTSKVDVTFAALLVNNGNINTTVTVNIAVNETGSGSVIYSDVKTGVWVDVFMGATVVFNIWNKVFSAETTYWVNVTLSAAGSNSDTTNDNKWEPLIIRDVHDVGPSGFENIILGNFFHPSQNVDLSFIISNFGTFDEEDGFYVECTVWNKSAMPWTSLYTETIKVFDTIPLQAQTGGNIQFPTTWITPTSYTPCRVEVTTNALNDQVPGNNVTYWDVEVDNRFDAAVRSLEASPKGPFAPNMTVDINATIENIGNMDLSDVNLTCTVTVDSIPLYTAYRTYPTLPAAETDIANYQKALVFTPNWTVPNVNGTAVINLTLRCVQDNTLYVSNNFMEISYPIYAEKRNLELNAINVEQSPVASPGDVVFNITIKNYHDPIGGFQLNTTVFDPTMTMIAWENVTIPAVIPGNGGLGYHDFVWSAPETLADGEYTCYSVIYLLGDINKDNNDKQTKFQVDFIHDLSIANTTGIHDSDVLNIPKGGKDLNIGIEVINKGPAAETFGVNATILDSEYNEVEAYWKTDQVVPGLGSVNVTFPHNFPVGKYNILYDVLLSGDEALADNHLNISFELTNITLPVAVIVSPKDGEEVALGSKLFLNGSMSKAITEGTNITSYLWTGNWTAAVLSTAAEAEVEITTPGWLGITLTVTDNLGQMSSASVSVLCVPAVTETFEFYGLKMEYSYRADTTVTPTAKNLSAAGTSPLDYLGLDLYYEAGIEANPGGKIYWVNVSLDPTPYGSEEKLDLVEDGSLTVFSLNGNSWSLPSKQYGAQDNDLAWFYVPSIASTGENFVLGLFGKRLTGMSAELAGVVAKFNTTTGISNATVSLYRDGDEVNSTTTDDTGAFVMLLELGIFEVRVSHEDYLDLTVSGVVVGKSGRELVLGLVPIEKGVVDGKVTDSKTKAAIPGAKVELFTSTGSLSAMEGVTNANGTYRLIDVDNGGYYLVISKDGYTPLQTDPFHITETEKEITYDVELVKLNNRPELTEGGFDPPSGKDTKRYSFWVTYTDLDNHAPNSNGVQVKVGDEKFTMAKDPSDNDFTDGVKYTLDDVKLGAGEHTVIFMATDSEGSPAYSLSLQNKLKVNKDESKAEMTTMLIAATVILIIIVLLVVAIVFLLFRRKAKKDQEALQEVTPEVDTKVSELMCTGCGSVLPEGTQKCPKCGRDLKKVEAEHAKEFKCPTCGAANPIGSKKCTACHKDFYAKVHDTTKMADDPGRAQEIVAETDQAEQEAAWNEPIESAGEEDDGLTEEAIETMDSEEISDADFDDGLTFEGFDEL